MYAINKHLKINITLVLVLLILSTAHAAAVTVNIDAPEYVSGSSFDVEIEIDNIDDLDSGQFDIKINSSIINVEDLDDDIENGEIGGIEVPIDNCYFVDANLLRLLFNIAGVDGVSGSGTLAVIKFKVVGQNEETSPLDLVDGLLVDKDSNEIEATWEGTTITIGGQTQEGNNSSSAFPITIYVRNVDDDKLDVHLLIDGIDEDFKTISTSKTKEYDSYKLEEGVHTITIIWFDPDTSEWYEKIKEITVTGTETLILTTDEHDDDDKDKISAHIYVTNTDKDNVDAYLYIDGNFKKFVNIPKGSTSDFGEYEFEEDEESLHSFKLKWYDPSAEEEYEKIERHHITSEEGLNLSIDSHVKGETMTVTEGVVSTTSTETSNQSTKSSDTNESQSTAGGGGISDSEQATQEPEDKSTTSNDYISINNVFILVGFAAILFTLYKIRKV